MFIKNANMLVTNAGMKKKQSDNTDYCAVGLLSLDDGQKFDVSVKDSSIYMKLVPMSKVIVDLALTNSKYGLGLSVVDVVNTGEMI